MQAQYDARFERPKLRIHPRWLWSRIVNTWPFFVWLGVIALAVFFYVRSTQFGLLPGTAMTLHHDIAPLQASRVKEIYVQIGDHVTNGQIVVQMDTMLVDVQLAQAEATLAAAQDTLAAYEAQMHSLVRTFENQIATTQVLLDQQKNLRDSDTSKLAELKSIQTLRDELYKNKLIDEVVANALRPEIAALEKTVAAYPAVIATYERILEENKSGREDLRKSLRIAPGEDIMKAIAEKTAARAKILEAAVDMRKLDKETFSLRAPADGIVSDITIYPGNVAQAAASVMTIISGSRQIIGYLPEMRQGRLKIGDSGFAFRIGHSPIKVRVVAVAPVIEALLPKLSPVSTAQSNAFRSQRVVFEIDGASDLIAGERLQIRMTNEWLARVRQRWSL